MKFCNNCGQQMEDESVFCPNCGATNEAAPAAPAAKAAGNDIMAKAKGFGEKVVNVCKNFVNAAMKDKKLLIVPAAAIVGVIAVILVISLLFSNPYKKAIKDYVAINVSYQASEKQYEAQMPKDAWDYLEEEEEIEFDEEWEEYEKSAEYIQEALEDEFGEYKVTVKIKDSSKLSDKKLKEYKNELEEDWDIKKKDVKVGYKVKLEVSIKGDDDKDSDSIKAVVVKYKGDWYVVDMETPEFISDASEKAYKLMYEDLYN